jgi:hypothetical protein
VGPRVIAGVAAALVAAGCSGAGESREETTPRRQSSPAAETTAGESVAPARVLATLIAPETLARPRHRYANLGELRWAGAWRAWRKRIEHASDRLAVIFDGRTPDPVAPRRFVELFGRCSQDVTAFGSIPSTRLREVVQSTAEACERYEIAAATLAESGGEGPLPPEVYFGLRHIEEADRALDRSIIGLSREIVPLPLLDRPARQSRIQIRYSYVASRLEAQQITVHCYDREDWRRELRERGRRPDRIAGFVELHSVSGNLAPEICRRLDFLTYRKRRPRDLFERALLAQAVATLGHEAQHARGIRRESRAECYGMQRIKALARALGASPDYSSGLAEVYWQYVYPALPATYQSDACGPGKKLDLHPRSPAWP